MPMALINGQSLYYQDTGGDGPVVVLAHNVLLDSRMFEMQVRHLTRGTRRWRCLSWDARGHGHSLEGANHAFSLDDVADDLEALLAYLNIEQALCLGVSQGGQVALRHALRHPQRVQGLALVATAVRPDSPGHQQAYLRLMRGWLVEGMSAPLLTALSQRLLGQQLPDSVQALWQAHWALQPPLQIQHCIDAFVLRDDLMPRLPEVRVPTLVLHGLKDRMGSAPHAEAVARALPQGRLVLLPGVDHAPTFSHAGLVHAALDAFLGQIWPQALDAA